MTLQEISVKAYDVHEHWKGLMPLMLCEEFGELMQAVSKIERGMTTDGTIGFPDPLPNLETTLHITQDFAPEVADVIISLMAMCRRYDIDVKWIEKCIEGKLSKEY